MAFIIENWELISLVLLLIFMCIREIAKLTKTKKDDQFVEYVSDRLETFGIKLDLTPSYVVDKVGQKLKENKIIVNNTYSEADPDELFEKIKGAFENESGRSVSTTQENPKQRE